mgnify:FL=1
MNKAELVAAMAEKTELSKKDAEAALKAFTDVVAEELKNIEFNNLLDVGCGTGPMIELFVQEFPNKEYTGIDLHLK